MTVVDDVRRGAVRAVESEVHVLGRRLRRALQERAAAVGSGLTPIGYLVLGHLVQTGPVRQVDLVDAFDLEKGAVSRLVQHLVEQGLVERTADLEDGRARRVNATDEAVRVLAEVDAGRRERYHARLADLGDDDLLQLATLLGRYNRAVEG